MQRLPRGVRNNNPGNIDYNEKNKWQGQLGIEEGVPLPRFARFDTPQNGIRAIAKLLLNYHKKGFTTVQAMINRWAPPTENNTDAYVKAVAHVVGVAPTEHIPQLSLYQLVQMTQAIIRHENGYEPFNRAVVTDGVKSAMI